MKPRTRDALLFAVYGRNAAFVLQLVNGSITLTVDNGDKTKGDFSNAFNATFTPEAEQNFCDGEWHSVTAVKSQYVITLIVDKINSSPTIGSTTYISTDTSRPLFLGGHPKIAHAKHVVAKKPFIGCMRNIKIREVPTPINVRKVSGQVHVGVCPLK